MMVKPLEILEKILQLEEMDYSFQDKAVAGGLACYADTWQKQAGAAFGESALPWVDDIANRLRAYSSLQLEARREAMQALKEVLRRSPAAEEQVEALPPQPDVAPRRQTQVQEGSGRGLEAPVQMLAGVGKKRAEQLGNLGVATIRDLLFFYPRRYEDYSNLKTIDHLQFGERVSLLATVWEAGGRQTRGGRYLFRAILSDNTGTPACKSW
jgi:ATP-dependent DNA helicase RecG